MTNRKEKNKIDKNETNNKSKKKKTEACKVSKSTDCTLQFGYRIKTEEICLQYKHEFYVIISFSVTYVDITECQLVVNDKNR